MGLRDGFHQDLPLALLIKHLLRVGFVRAGFLLSVQIVAHLNLLEGHVEDLAHAFFVIALQLRKLQHVLCRGFKSALRVRINLLKLQEGVLPTLMHDLSTD